MIQDRAAAQPIYGDVYFLGRTDVSIIGGGGGVRSCSAGIINKEMGGIAGSSYTAGNLYSMGEIETQANGSVYVNIGNNVVANRLTLKSNASTEGAAAPNEFIKAPGVKYNFKKGLYVDPYNCMNLTYSKSVDTV